jgi:hypothetical protein
MPNAIRVPSLRLTELDGSPDIQGVERIYLTNGFMSNLGNGAALLSLSGSASSLTVRDIDGAPSVSNVTSIYLTNGFLSDLGNGSVLLSMSGAAGGGGAPADATYITQTANGTLSNEQALSSLSSGLMFVTTGTGVVTSVSLVSDSVTRTAGDISVSSTSFVDATSMTLTQTTGARRVLVTVIASSGAIGASSVLSLDIDIDGSRQGQVYGLTSVGVGPIGNLSFTYLTAALSAGSHTFKLQTRTDLSACTLKASTNFPLIMQIKEMP